MRDGDKRIVRLKEGSPAGRHVVIVDDLVQSGGTLIECQSMLAQMGAKHGRRGGSAGGGGEMERMMAGRGDGRLFPVEAGPREHCRRISDLARGRLLVALLPCSEGLQCSWEPALGPVRPYISASHCPHQSAPFHPIWHSLNPEHPHPPSVTP